MKFLDFSFPTGVAQSIIEKKVQVNFSDPASEMIYQRTQLKHDYNVVKDHEGIVK